MSSETGRLRILTTGSCDGLEEILEGLAGHPGLELVGASENVADATGALTGGHLDVVLHATASSELPADEVATIKEHTAAPVIVIGRWSSTPTTGGIGSWNIVMRRLLSVRTRICTGTGS